MSELAPDRKLTGPEIDFVTHLLRHGGSMMPLAALPGARKVGSQLWRLGIITIWYRQSLASGRLEGPFYSLTRIGAYRAEALHTARGRRGNPNANHQLCSATDAPPPPKTPRGAWKMQIRDYDPKRGDFPQGDICIFAIPEAITLSASATEIAPVDGRLIIQEGEATGHHHAIALPRQRNFRQQTAVADPVLTTRDTKLRKVFGGGKVKTAGSARLYRDASAVEQLRQCGELTRTDLAIGILVVEGGPVVLAHEEHDGIRLPHAWQDAEGRARTGRFYVGRQIESAGAEERVVID